MIIGIISIAIKLISLCSILQYSKIRSDLSIVYSISGNGNIDVEMKFNPGIKGLQNLPRFGMLFVLKDTDELEYYGRGPHENYCDRNTSAFVGQYSGSITDQHFAYTRPQENGCKTDTRWLIIGDRNSGLFISAKQPISFSALHIPTEMLDPITRPNYKHTVDVKQLPETCLHIDMKQMGVGGDNSWGHVHTSRIKFPHKNMSLSLLLSPGKRVTMVLVCGVISWYN